MHILGVVVPSASDGPGLDCMSLLVVCYHCVACKSCHRGCVGRVKEMYVGRIYTDKSSRLRFFKPRLLSEDDESEELPLLDDAAAARWAASYKTWPISSSKGIRG